MRERLELWPNLKWVVYNAFLIEYPKYSIISRISFISPYISGESAIAIRWLGISTVYNLTIIVNADYSEQCASKNSAISIIP